MPKRTSLHNQHIAVQKGSEIDPVESDENGPVVKEVWSLVFTDKSYGDQISVTFGREARDSIVKDLMGGVILPGTI